MAEAFRYMASIFFWLGAWLVLMAVDCVIIFFLIFGLGEISKTYEEWLMKRGRR